MLIVSKPSGNVIVDNKVHPLNASRGNDVIFVFDKLTEVIVFMLLNVPMLERNVLFDKFTIFNGHL